MSQVLGAAALFCVVAALGCESDPKLTAEQWSALETRPMNGARDDVLRAASSVVLDQGYLFRASDRDAGIVVGIRVPSESENAFRRSGGMQGPVMSDVVCVWVRPVGPNASEVRVQIRIHGSRINDPQRITVFCAATERRMLGGSAAPEHADAGGDRR